MLTIGMYEDLRVSEWVGFNGTSTQFRSLAASLTQKAGTESPTVKDTHSVTTFTAETNVADTHTQRDKRGATQYLLRSLSGGE